jgi:hypothetical protein
MLRCLVNSMPVLLRFFAQNQIGESLPDNEPTTTITKIQDMPSKYLKNMSEQIPYQGNH